MLTKAGKKRLLKLTGHLELNSFTNIVEMATAQRTRPRAVVGAPRRAAWQLKSVLRHSVSAAPRSIIFTIFLQLMLVNYFFISKNG